MVSIRADFYIINCARLISESLKAHAVTTIFGYLGRALMPTYDAISGLDHLLCRNQQAIASSLPRLTQPNNFRW